ncbi:MAG: hypothetical protein FP827_04285 [Candidatus Omnitrophica bacterium]|nr:hypothetical protein [Candidatus Omnitrophota bacterium]
MRKYIIAIMLLGLSLPVSAWMVQDGISYSSSQSTRITRGFSLYATGGATTTAISFKRFVSSMSVTQTAGISAGTTHFVYADSDKNTIGEFVDYLNAIPNLTVGCEAGLVAVIDPECYEGNLTSEITGNTTATTIHSATNTVTVGLDHILGMIEIIPVPKPGYTHHVVGFNTNVTFGAGATSMYIRKGALSTSDIGYQKKVTTTATKEVMEVPLVVGEVDTAIRFEVIGSSWISAGYFNRTIKQR